MCLLTHIATDLATGPLGRRLKCGVAQGIVAVVDKSHSGRGVPFRMLLCRDRHEHTRACEVMNSTSITVTSMYVNVMNHTNINIYDDFFISHDDARG